MPDTEQGAQPIRAAAKIQLSIVVAKTSAAENRRSVKIELIKIAVPSAFNKAGGSGFYFGAMRDVEALAAWLILREPCHYWNRRGKLEVDIQGHEKLCDILFNFTLIGELRFTLHNH